MRNLFLGLVAVGALASVGSATIAPANGSHRSSLAATVMLRDGSTQKVTIEGVGCNSSMCSRVQVREYNHAIWLDDVTEVSNISRISGPVTATFRMKTGASGEARIVSGNRVLYVRNAAGAMEKLDLAEVAKIDF